MSDNILEFNKPMPPPDLSSPQKKLEWLLLQAILVHIGMGRSPQQFIDTAAELFNWVDRSLLADFEE